MTDDTTIGEKVNRLEELIETLESGDPSLERATELKDEGEELLAELRAGLDLGNGEVVRRD